jgi:biopolymer transport protein ExbD
MEFNRTTKRTIAALNLTPLIDVLFILIIFFMLTTTFMKIESMELILPSTAAGKAAEKQEVVRIFVQDNGDMLLGNRKLNEDEMSESLSRMFDKDPNTRVMLLTADGVTMQQLVDLMDRIYLMGGKSLFVRKWDTKSRKAS